MFLEMNHEVAGMVQPRVAELALPQETPCDPQRTSVRGCLPLKPHRSTPAQKGIQIPEAYSPRCREKGCVFPSEPGRAGLCAYHCRQVLEPDCFSSQQPTHMLLEHARFNLLDSGRDDSRTKDRRKLAAERSKFMLEDGA